MVWITMSLAPHAGNKKRKKAELNLHSQVNKCLNEKRRREQENIHIEELAELVSASPSDMSSLSCKPDKCAILKETVNQIRLQKHTLESELCDDLQQSEVSSSKPNIINNHIFGSILLEALEGFLFVVNADGKIEFVSDNITTFLKFNQDDITEKNIYDFIHPDDRPRFNSNLLLMMPLGNGPNWTSENCFSSAKPTKHFNCRFLIKQDDPEMKMDKVPLEPQYENLNITANYVPLSDGANEEQKNVVTCIARRAPFEDKKMLNKVEQFTTRMDREGKVIDIDVNTMSPVNGLFMKKELLGALMADFCHPSDLATFKQHLRETFESENATCVLFKLRVGLDRYARIKTKSKRFRSVSIVEEFVISTHCVIREVDNMTLDSLKCASSPSSLASTSSGPGSVSDSSASVNGNIALSPMSFSNFTGALAAVNSSDFALSDLVLDMFPSTNWNLDPGSSQSKESDSASVRSFAPSPHAAPLSNCSDSSTAPSPSNNAFIGNQTASRSGTTIPSPLMQNRAPTPYGGNCFSPATSQASNGRGSPSRVLSAKSDSMNCSSSDTPHVNMLSNSIRQQFDSKPNQKLRHLLTQNSDDSARQHSSHHALQDEVTVLVDTRSFGDSDRSLRESLQSGPKVSNNVILRDLLNHDSNDSDVPVEPIMVNPADSQVPNPLLNIGACNQQAGAAQLRLGNNNMLRKLLNNDDVDRNYRKPQDLIQQLLQPNSSNRVPFQNDRLRQEMPNIHANDSSVPKPMNVDVSSGASDVTFIAMKRKANDKPIPTSAPKKQNNGTQQAHLAGQNPMLASMLAQTPRTPPTVPTSVASSIMTQLPQERLPKNLEKKLVHTPYTAIPLNATTASLSYSLTSSSVQRDIITSDSRGHVLQSSSHPLGQQSQSNYAQQQNLYNKILSANEENLILAKTLGIGLSNASALQSAASYAAGAENVGPTSLADILNNSSMVDVPLSDTVQSNQASDPVFAEILEQIYSLQEDHNVDTSRSTDDSAAILKLLGNVIDTPASGSISNTIAQDISEKMAISAIQRELMEASSHALNNRTSISLLNNAAGASAVYSQVTRAVTPSMGMSRVQSQFTREQLLQQQSQVSPNSMPPNYPLVTNRVRLPGSVQPSSVTQESLLAQQRRAQAVRAMGATNVNAANAELRKNMKQRLYLQQQQKRLLEQQQKQQLTMQTQQPVEIVHSPGINAFPENMNDLLNNTVAPNVSLLRMSAEIPGSARFNFNSAASQPSPTSQASPIPSQLSPNQPSPFSPPVQQQAPPPSYPSGTRVNPSQSPTVASSSTSTLPSPQSNSGISSPQWSQRVATSPIQNLQLQNPMLNAQLSQASISTNQIRLTPQQRQQLTLRSSLQSSTSVQTSKGPSLQSQADSGYASLSPVMVLQSPSPQQQSQAPQLSQLSNLQPSQQHTLSQTLQQQLQSQALQLQTQTLQQQQIKALQQQMQAQAVQQQRIRNLSGRVAAVSQSQSPMLNNESVLSPQPLPSPSFSQATTPTSAFIAISSSSGPATYSLSTVDQHFNFERQNIQSFTNNSNDNVRTSSSDRSSSDAAIRQQLRSVISPQNQHLVLSSNNNQHILQSLSSGSVTRVLNLNSLTNQSLEEFGLSVDNSPGTSDAQPGNSQTIYSQGLQRDASNNLDNSAQSLSQRVEEAKPADQKKSLLQQLLSEPT